MSATVLNPEGRTWRLGSQQTLWRYVDIEAFVRLLATFDPTTGLADLFLTRLDRLRLHDPSEGRFPRELAKLLAVKAQSEHPPPALTPTQAEAFWAHGQRLSGDEEYRNSIFPDDSLPALMQYVASTDGGTRARLQDFLMGRMCYVSCWHLGRFESHAMWRIYSKDRGIAIRTTVGRLARSLASADSAYIGRVQYSKDAMLGSWPSAVIDTLFPFAFWKRPPFEYEREVRVVMPVGPTASFYDDDEPGQTVPVRLRELITEIVVSPFGGEDLVEVVSAIVERFAPRVNVRRSTLLDTPSDAES